MKCGAWRLAYAFGIAKNHLMAMNLFLEQNGWSLTAGEADATLTFLKLTASDITEAELAAWIESHLAQRP